MVVFVLTGWLDPNHTYFTSWTESRDIIRRNTALLGIIALGAAVVIISGGIDLPAGSMVAFSATTCGLILALCSEPDDRRLVTVGPLGITAAVGGAIASGLLVGTLHSWLITAIRLPPFVATLATLVGLRSFARAMCLFVTRERWGSESQQINVNTPFFAWLKEHNVWIMTGTFLVLAALTWLILSRTVLGRHLYAVGGNPQAARLSGIRTENVSWFTYCFGSVTAALAGVFLMADSSVAQPGTLARGYELNAIAAAVVGGCSLQGGVGSVSGTVFGALFLRVVIDAVSKLIKASADVYEGMIVGILVALAVTFTQMGRFARGSRTIFPGLRGLAAIPTIAIFAGLLAMMGASNVEPLRGRTAAVMTPIVSFHGVGKRFPGVVALEGISFDLHPGECHAICGENGAGKSTLMKILSGVIVDYDGEIRVRGEPIRLRGTRDAEAAGVAITHQELNLVEQFSAAATIFLSRERRTSLGLLDDAAMERDAATLLADLECPIDPRTPAAALRVGDQQLVEIAKALSLCSDVLIMDEPTSALTETEVARLERVLCRLRSRGVTLLSITHKMDEVFRLADRITVLRDGRLVATVDKAATSPRCSTTPPGASTWGPRPSSTS